MEKFDNTLKEKNSSLCREVQQNNKIFNCNIRKFSFVLKELRLEKGLSLLALSKRTGISHTSLCRWENGKADVSGDSIYVLAKFFKVSADYLLGLVD